MQVAPLDGLPDDVNVGYRAPTPTLSERLGVHIYCRDVSPHALKSLWLLGFPVASIDVVFDPPADVRGVEM
jgi:hypothetical protein